MKTFTINGKNIEFDDSKTYLDFYIENGKQMLVSIDFAGILTEAVSHPIDSDFTDYMRYLERWVVDAPRKKGYRQMRKDGFVVLSAEQFFDGDDGIEVIDNLENTGRMAELIIQQLGLGGKKWYTNG